MWHSLSCQSMLEEQPVTVHPGIADKPPLKYWWSFFGNAPFFLDESRGLSAKLFDSYPFPLPVTKSYQGTRDKGQETGERK